MSGVRPTACIDTVELERLLAHRSAPAGAEPPGLAAALRHLDGCRCCRAAALALDPTLVFRSVPAPELDEAAEVTAMLGAVRAMRRTRELELRSRRRRTLGRVAAAAVLAGLAILQTPPADRGTAAPVRSARVLAALPAVTTAAFQPYADPLVEPLGGSPEVVYQVEDGGLALVMMIDAELDV